MRTNVEIDEQLLKRAKKLGKTKTTRAVIEKALLTFVEVHERKSLLDLRGKIKFAKGYDHKLARGEG